MTDEPEIDVPDPVYLDTSKIVVITREDGSVLYAPLKDERTDRAKKMKADSGITYWDTGCMADDDPEPKPSSTTLEEVSVVQVIWGDGIGEVIYADLKEAVHEGKTIYYVDLRKIQGREELQVALTSRVLHRSDEAA